MNQVWRMLVLIMVFALSVGGTGAARAGPNVDELIERSRTSTQDDGIPGYRERVPTATGARGYETTAARAPSADTYARVTYSALRQRSGPGTGYAILQTIKKGEVVHVLSNATSTGWYRTSYRGKIGYAIGAGLTYTSLAGQLIGASYSRVIVVSLARQQMEVYEGGRLKFISAVTTGRPDLRTPTGTFTMFQKVSPKKWVSPWPPGSPYYYEDGSTSRWALKFTSGGHYFHDAPWRPYYGYGTQVNHQDPDGAWRTGSHGCVNVPEWQMGTLYAWTTNGTTIRILST